MKRALIVLAGIALLVVAGCTELRTGLTGSGSTSGYSRAQFGGELSQVDSDGNGCTDRDDVIREQIGGHKGEWLARDGGCPLTGGRVWDPYTADLYDEETGIQVDHIYPLSLAWKTGAEWWSAAKRVRFAHDPANLMAVSTSANAAKGDSGPGEWRPAEGHCWYAHRFTAVVSKYRLTVQPADRVALRDLLAEC